MGRLFNRYANLTVFKGGSGLDLSQMKFSFRTSNNDADTPTTARIRVYNLSDRTSLQSMKEFDSVTIDVGYQDNHAIIFKGTIRQLHRGKETDVDRFLDILAGDNDLGYNFGIINRTFPPNTTPQQELKAYADEMELTVDDSANQFLSQTGGIVPNPRGKVAYGLARTYARELATTYNARWFANNGVLYLVPIKGYLPGEAVVINSMTGMVGIPEATESGIIVKTLLNPLIKIGGRIQLNNRDITQTEIRDRYFPGYTSQTFVANTSSDGTYRVMVCEHEGDTRDDTWYTEITALAIDQSASIFNSVVP